MSSPDRPKGAPDPRTVKIRNVSRVDMGSKRQVRGNRPTDDVRGPAVSPLCEQAHGEAGIDLGRLIELVNGYPLIRLVGHTWSAGAADDGW